MNTRIFHIIFVIAFLEMIILRVYYGRKARQNREGVEHKESNANLSVGALLGFGYISAMIIYIIHPSLFHWAAISLPNWVHWLGAFITVGNVLFLWWVQWALDVQFDGTLHTQEDHKLIQHGPYQWVRHPMYTVFFLMGLGWFLLTANWFVGVPLMIGIVFVVLSRVKNEEDGLIELFGDEYQNYIQQTGHFLPTLVRN